MPYSPDYYQLKDLIQQYHDAVYERVGENRDRSRKLITRLLDSRYDNRTDNAVISVTRILLSSSSMLNSILDATNGSQFESFGRRLILQCLNYYTDADDLLTDRAFSEYGTGVLIDDAYIISVIYSWLKDDFKLMDKLSTPSDQILRAILGQGLASELDNKAREIVRASLADVKQGTQLRSLHNVIEP